MASRVSGQDARAPWRRRPDDPRTSLGWLARDLDAPAGFVARELAWSLRVFALLCAFAGRIDPDVPVALLLSFMPEPIVATVASLLRLRRAPGTLRFFAPPLPVDDLLALPPPTTPYPCALAVRRAGVLLGRDLGIATFVEGWLCFEGRRTSFAIRACDVVRSSDAAKREKGRIALTDGGEIAFAPQDSLRAPALWEWDLAARFEDELDQWMRDDAPPGDSLFPPARPHASGVARAWGQWAASLLAGAAFVALSLGAGSPLWAVAFGASFGVGTVRAAGALRRLRGERGPLSDGATGPVFE